MTGCLAYSILPKEECLALHKVKGQWPVHGSPKTIHVDKGASSDLKKLAQACAKHGIVLECSARISLSHMGFIEKFLKSLEQSLHAFSSKATSLRKNFGKNDASQESSGMTKFEFESFLLDFIVNVYHQRTQATLGTSPQAKWDDAA